MIYIASPYSKNTLDAEYSYEEEHRDFRYRSTREYVAKLLQQKKWCYSPIVHCHDLANTHNLPTDAEFWWDYNKHFLDRADQVHVLKLVNWEGSKGVAKEIQYAVLKNIEVIYVKP